jgi:hypothetical protein
MNELIITAVFIIYLVIRERMHDKEVELLSKALIAKNVYELKEVEDTKPMVEKAPKYIPETELNDEEFMASVRKQIGKQKPSDKFKEKISKLWQTKLK